MMSHRFSIKQKQIITALAIPLAVLVLVWFYDTVVWLTQLAGPCRLYTFTGLQCPACGGTRSATALLQGDIWLSLWYNPVVVFFCLLGGTLYTELVLRIFNIHFNIVPRGRIFLWGSLWLFFIFYIARLFFPFLVPSL